MADDWEILLTVIRDTKEERIIMLNLGYTGARGKRKHHRYMGKPQMNPQTRERMIRKTRNEFRRFLAEMALVAIAAICGASLLCVFAFAFGETSDQEAEPVVAASSVETYEMEPTSAVRYSAPPVEVEEIEEPESIVTTRLGVVVDSYDATVDYQSLINETYELIADDGSNADALLAVCEVYEAQRNYKIEDTESTQDQTSYFNNDLSYEEIDRMINPPWYDYTEADVEALAAIVYAEGGSTWVSDEHQQSIASVGMNRVVSSEWNGDTIREVINSPGQYPATCKNTYFDERSYSNALYVLENGPTSDAVYQANFEQGDTIVAVYSYPGHSTTYICK